MDSFFLSIAIIGLLGLSVCWLPTLTKKINVSYSIVFLALGWITYSILGDKLPYPDPFREQELTVRLTELLVIIALMGTGLRIDRPFSFKSWRAPLRLISGYMLVSFLLVWFLVFIFLGFPAAVAMLFAAVITPTDPVLASDVQAAPPNSGKSNDVRFALTAEAGLNDGLAFPLTWLAIAFAQSTEQSHFFWSWLEFDVLWRLSCGGILGFLMGKLVAFFFFTLPEKYKALHVRDGLVALSACLLTYGVTEMFNGYGFIAVFVCAVTLRNHEFKHKYHQKLHSFIDQIERILLSVLIFLFGGSLYGGILDDLTWSMAIMAIFLVLFFRPLVARLSLFGVKMTNKEKWITGFYGIKGVGSFFYLSFALKKYDFTYQQELWSLVSFVVLASILIHGLTAVYMMKKV
ncbi:MAG: cation transporter [Halobacteriovoraceae bacterium]|nr:cation transporter [Halobacteriovoraceae bacterium]